MKVPFGLFLAIALTAPALAQPVATFTLTSTRSGATIGQGQTVDWQVFVSFIANQTYGLAGVSVDLNQSPSTPPSSTSPPLPASLPPWPPSPAHRASAWSHCIVCNGSPPMTNDSTLTRLEKKITEDWHHEFPTLSVYKSRWLLRRAGPLLAGIVLDRTSGGDIYRPCFHLHCLCRAFPVVSLTLRTQLRTERNGSPTSVKVRMHEQTYRSAAELLKKQIPDLIEGDIAFDAVLRSYSDYLASPSGRGVAANLYADMIGLCVWAREIDKAASLLTDALSLPRDTAYRPYDGLAGFEALCRQMIDSPSFVDETVEQQIVFHKVQALPVSRLIAPNRAA